MVNCRITNRLIAFHCNQLTSYLYQNEPIFYILLLFLMIVMNNKANTTWIFSFYAKSKYDMKIISHDYNSKRNCKQWANSHEIVSLITCCNFKISLTSQNKVCLKTSNQIHLRLKWLSFWNLDGSNMYVPTSDNCIFYVIKWCRVKKKKKENNHIECKCSNDNFNGTLQWY